MPKSQKECLMSLILKSMLRFTDGKVNKRNVSNLYLQVRPSKLRGPYDLKPLAEVEGKIISAEPLESENLDDSYNSMYESVNGTSIEFIYHPAYEIKDFLFLTKQAQNRLIKVGVVPDKFILTVEINRVKSGLMSKKVYPLAQVHDNEI